MRNYEKKKDCDKTRISETATQIHVKIIHRNKIPREKIPHKAMIYINWRSLTSSGAIHVVVTFCFTSEFALLTAEFCN